MTWVDWGYWAGREYGFLLTDTETTCILWECTAWPMADPELVKTQFRTFLAEAAEERDNY